MFGESWRVRMIGDKWSVRAGATGSLVLEGSSKASDGSAPGPTAQRERAGVSLGPPGSGCEDTEVRSVSLARGPNRWRLVAVAAGCSSWAGFWQLG